MPTLLYLIGGFLCLLGGGELLVRGSSRLAAALGLSPLAIGLTVVAYGTSAPELAVSVGAASIGKADLALGNVVGSNIFNVLFILGLSALIAPLRISLDLVRRDVPIMIGVSLLALGLAADGRVSRIEGVLLLALGLGYTLLALRSGGARVEASSENPAFARRSWPVPTALVVVGLLLLVLGSRWLIAGASTLARALGVSELVIGLTLVAAGTSLPEVAASVVAALRKERDIAVGNVVGSNIFNLVFVLAGAAVVSAGGVAVSPAALRFDLPVMVAVALACLPIFFTGFVIARWEGLVFFLYYLFYTGFLVLAAQQHAALASLRTATLRFVLPLTLLMLVLSVLHSLRRRHPATPTTTP